MNRTDRNGKSTKVRVGNKVYKSITQAAEAIYVCPKTLTQYLNGKQSGAYCGLNEQDIEVLV